MGLHLSSHSGTVSAKESAVFYVPSRPNGNQTQSEPLKRRSVSRSRSLHEDRHNRLSQEPVAASRRFSLQSVQRPAVSCYNENPGEGPAPSFVSEGITDSLVLLRAELQKCKRTTSEHSWTEKLSFKKLSGGLREKTLCRGDTAKRSPNWNFWKRKSKMKKVSEDISEASAFVSSGAGSSTGARLEVETEMSSDTDTSDFQDFGNSPDEIQLVPVESLRDPIIDLSRFNPEDYPIEDFEERARQERAREMAEGVDPPPGFRPGSAVVTPGVLAEIHLNNLTTLFHNSLTMNLPSLNALTHISSDLQLLAAQHGLGNVLPHTSASRGAHTQVDYIHCLVPDLLDITLCSFYWWKMDRYEAERLLDNKPDGTFLLRDSAQEEYLFSVSFRRYSRSLHARIEQWNHKFSFDSHDPGVFASPSVCGLMEHYKDPSCCMFFEPMLTIPLLRTFVFPLQHLCRAVICKSTTYDGISSLQLPRPLKVYLKEYHYKQRVRVRRLEAE